MEGSKLQQRALAKEKEWEASGFVPPDVVVRPTKPRIPGGQWSKSERNVGVGGGRGSDPFLVDRHPDEVDTPALPVGHRRVDHRVGHGVLDVRGAQLVEERLSVVASEV